MGKMNNNAEMDELRNKNREKGKSDRQTETGRGGGGVKGIAEEI